MPETQTLNTAPAQVGKTPPSFWHIFIPIILIYWVLTFFSSEMLFDDALYYRSCSGQLSQQTIEDMLALHPDNCRGWWTGYGYVLLTLSLKLLFAAVCISIGAVLASVELNFRKVLKNNACCEGMGILSIFSNIKICKIINNNLTWGG